MQSEYLARMRKIAERALARTQRVGDCIEYQGGKDKNGYGKTTTSFNNKRVDLRLHRVVFEAKTGELLGSDLVMHMCDNPPCINGEHLERGNNQTNVADCIAKGRRVYTGPKNPSRGKHHYMAKLTPRAVAAIRRSKEPLRVLASRYGVSIASVQRARVGATWAPR
jgi:hypothetical protein